MDYEKEYKRIVAKIKVAYSNALTDSTKNVLVDILPTLAESESERIRQRLINLIRELANAKLPIHTSGYFADGQDKKYIAWLEKQKEPHYTERNTFFDKYVENCDPAIMKEVSDNVDMMLEKEQKQAEWSVDDMDKVATYLHECGIGLLWSKAKEITQDICGILRPL